MEDSTKVNQFVISDSDADDGDDSPDGKVDNIAKVDGELQLPDKNGASTGSMETMSSCSSPLPLEPFHSRYISKLLPKAVSKDGDTVTYTIHSTRRLDNEKSVVRRQYEDFEYLNHCLTTTAYPGDGIIFPPLPAKSATTADSVQGISKQKLGQASKTLICDEWHKDCFHLQEYLRFMLDHPMFGRSSDIWDKFLAAVDPPARVKVKKAGGLINRITDSIESRGKSTHPDIDDFFRKERDWVNVYAIVAREASELFNQRTYARMKLGGVLGHLSTALNLNLATNDSEQSKAGARFCSLFSVGLDNYRKGLDAMAYNDEATLGSSLELWSRMLDAERDMLYRRTCLLVECEIANRNLDKAKSNKKDAAEQAKLDADRAFEDCSDVARLEIRCFQKNRARALGAALENYGEAQLLVARDLYQIVRSSLDGLKKFSFH